MRRCYSTRDKYSIHICILYKTVQATGCDAGASTGQSGRDTTQIRADTETDGDFTPAWEKKWLFNIKPQHITLKPAGQTKRDRESGEAAKQRCRNNGKPGKMESSPSILRSKMFCIIMIQFVCFGR